MMKKEHFVKSVQRLLWAKADFTSARDLSRFLVRILRRPRQYRDCVRALNTGIIVSYARPFGGNEGIGALPEKFTKFSNKEREQLHVSLIHVRNVSEAHTNALKRNSALLPDSAGSINDIRVTVDQGGVTMDAVPFAMNRETYRQIADLADEQVRRIDAAALIILQRFGITRSKWRDGQYMLGADFP